MQVVAAALALIAFASGLLNLSRFPYGGDQAASVVGDRVAQQHFDSALQPLRFVLTMTVLDPVNRRIQATVTLLNAEVLEIVDGDGKPVVQEGRLRSEFAEASLRIRLSNQYFGDVDALYPLKPLVEPRVSQEPVRVSASLPAYVDPALFPNDAYVLDFGVSVSLPDELGLVAPPNKYDLAKVYLDLPVVVGIAQDDRLGQLNMSTNTTVGVGGVAFQDPSSSINHGAVAVTVKFSRAWTYWLFIYSVSLMPAVIGLSFFVRSRRRGTSAALELAAALLALIALRQVFVPSDIVALTLLDIVLAVQLVALCWLMAVVHVGQP